MPGLSSDDHFQKVLGVAEREFKDKKIQVRFGPSGRMRFIIDEASLKDALAGSGVDETTFRRTFHSEVGWLLEAVVRNSLDEYIQNFAQYISGSADLKERAAQQEELRRRAKLVEALASPMLRARYLIKVLSRHPRLRFHAWEVSRKLEASDTQPGFPYPSATLSIETIQPEGELGMWGSLPFFPSESIGRTERCTFDCDEEDLEDLIRDLEAAKAALSRARKGQGNG